MPAFFPNKGEPAIDALELLSHGMEIKTQKKSLEPLFNTESKPSKIIKRELPPNFRCESCAIRLYPVKKFFHAGKLPVLLLHYNGLLSKSHHQTLPRDRSANFVFGNKPEDELFTRILEKLKFKWDDFNYQEYPACHFDVGTSSEEDWQERAQNCLEHVEVLRYTSLSRKKIFSCREITGFTFALKVSRQLKSKKLSYAAMQL